MKKRTLVNYFLVALVILAGLGLGVGLSKIGATRRPVGSAKPVVPQQAAAVDTRPLKEIPRKAGRYVRDQAPNSIGAFTDLAGLSSNSSAVVIGIPQDNVCNLSPDGRSITTDYKVKIMYVYKGSLQEGNTITVSLPGGRVAFDDGSTAEIRTSWFKKMMSGTAYALFLRATPRSGVFVTTGEAQGLFEIPKTVQDNQMIQTHTGLPNDPIWRYHRADARTFFKELRRVTGKPLKR